jgi:predicted component of type VI protein secretion system
MALQLTVETSGDSLSRFTYAFDQDEVTLGRSALCDVQLPFPTISTKHLRFLRQGRAWTVRDEGATNGTRLNQAPLPPHEDRPLRSGDVLQLEGATLHVQLPAHPEGPLTTSLRSGQLARHLLSLGAPQALDQRATLEVLEGLDKDARARLPHEGSFTISARGDWTLRDPALLPQTLRVTLTLGGYELALPPDLPALLDGAPQPPGATLLLKSGHRLRLGATTLLFLDPLQTKLAALETSQPTAKDAAEPSDAQPPKKGWTPLDLALGAGALLAALAAVFVLLLLLGVV